LGSSIRWKNPWPAAPRGAAGARAGFAFLQRINFKETKEIKAKLLRAKPLP
jgi:hypothetical protein